MAQAIAQTYCDEHPKILNPLEKELGMAAAKDPHGELMGELYSFFKEVVRDTHLWLKLDVYRYLDKEMLSRFGDLRKQRDYNAFANAMQRFGANKRYIHKKLDPIMVTGNISNSYAPDIFITTKNDWNDEYAIPLVTIEIISTTSRKSDLFYKSAFYECIGVEEYFIFETDFEQGRLVKAYRLSGDLPKKQRYEEIRPADRNYFSRVLNCEIPEKWNLSPF